MKPSKFTYYEPTSVEEAVVMLADVAAHEGRILAGGQTLVPAMALRFAQPAYLIDINGIRSLQVLSQREGALQIGACVRHAAFHAPVADGPLGALLSTVVKHIAHLPIRNRGTFCGSIANADPSSEWCLVAVTLGAVLQVQSLAASRDVAAQDFFLGYMTTALATDEMLVSARLPLLPAHAQFGFEEVSRRAGDFAQAVALAVVDVQGDTVGNVRLGLGGVESTPRRLHKAEAVLEGQVPTPALIDEAARIAAEDVEPLDTTEAGLHYRRRLTRTVVRRSLTQACAPVGGIPSEG